MPDDALQPCERFTVLASHPGRNVTACDVCDHPEEAHANSGRRTLSGAQIEALRREILIKRFDRREQEFRRNDVAAGPVNTNGDPVLHDPDPNSEQP
jgi:hypothetical protein